MLKSPKEDIAKEEVLQITELQTEIKLMVWKDLHNGIEKEETERKLNELINKVEIAGLESEPIRKGLRVLAKNTYWLATRELKKVKDKLEKEFQSAGLQVEGLSLKEMELKFRPLLKSHSKGLPVINDYRRKVREVMRQVAVTQGKPITRDGTSTYSLRNYAEMTVRYEANLKDVERLMEEGKDLVWTSSHADSSIRCESWQGRLYSLQGRSGVIDGIEFTPIQEALAGEKGDGNGIINGYNCRHRLIEYYKGSRPPEHYSKETIRREREVDQRQRRYENEIRNLKVRERLAGATDKQEAERINARWHKLEREYKIYSFSNKRPYYQWRTEIDVRPERV